MYTRLTRICGLSSNKSLRSAAENGDFRSLCENADVAGAFKNSTNSFPYNAAMSPLN